MKMKINNALMLITLFPLFLPVKFIAFSLIASILSISYYLFKIKITIRGSLLFILALLIGILFYLRDLSLSYNDLSNFKISYLILCILVASMINYQSFSYVSLKKILVLYTIINTIILTLQIFFPNFSIWATLAESNEHYLALLNGRPFGISGNPTHSGYITMLITLSLILLRVKLIYIIASFVSVIFILNKMSILLTCFSAISLYALSFKNLTNRVIVIIFGIFISSIIFLEFLLPYLEKWKDVGYNVHTITYRQYIYSLLLDSMKQNYMIFGESSLYIKIASDAFDSLLALLITKFGVILTFFIYIIIFSTLGKKTNIILYASLTIPSLTMVAFYNTSYIFPIFFLYYYINRLQFETNSSSL
ncbi:MAG: hypothetical protein Q4A62_01390 [Eikenella sp.]|nr:hypothetical protein [Eikenella sp.]